MLCFGGFFAPRAHMTTSKFLRAMINAVVLLHILVLQYLPHCVADMSDDETMASVDTLLPPSPLASTRGILLFRGWILLVVHVAQLNDKKSWALASAGEALKQLVLLGAFVTWLALGACK